ncbi:hypothetical protein LXL04_008400 [Taraxacum kok-saghyz]
MDTFCNGSIKRSSVTSPSFNDAGGNNENEQNPEMASKLKKQLPTKNFMSSTICTANKATVPKKKILGERNETLDVVEQPSLGRSSSFDSRSVRSPGNDAQKPYDPINNYLSPRPKFLRYNPNRRRKIYVHQGNEESVGNSNAFDAGLPYPGMELGGNSSGFADSCSKKESAEQDVVNDEGECEEDEEGESEEEEEEEEEEIEFKEDRFWNLKGLLKFVVVVIAVISTTQAICSMNSPTPLHRVENWSDVYGVAGLNFSEVGSCSLREAELVVGRLKEVDMVESNDGVHEDEAVREEEASDSLQGLRTPDFDVEIVEIDAVLDEMWSKQEDTTEIAASEVTEIHEVESEREVGDQMLTADSVENEEIAEESKEIYDIEGERDDDEMLTADSDENEEIAEYETAEETEEINDAETINRSETFHLNQAIQIGGFMLILASFGVMCAKRMKTSCPVTPSVAGGKHEAEREEIRVLEASSNASSFIQQTEEPLMNSTSLLKHDVSEEFSRIHAPSVELLGEFVFGEEADASNSLIQATTCFSSDTKSSHVVNSTGASVAYTEKTIKKQRRKNVESTTVVTPSSVRRSSRLQNRSIKSP